MSDQSKKSSSADQIKKQQQAADAKQAMADYLAQAAAVDANTARLRALRLAREAAQKEAEKNAPPKRATPGKKGKAAASSSTLTTWLNEQKKQGRRS